MDSATRKGSRPAILNPDLCIVGGGAAGCAVALAAAAMGLSCVLVEKRGRLGRSQAADLAEDMLIGAAWSGAGLGDVAGHAFVALRRRIGQTVSTAAPNNSAERLRAIGVEVIEATGRFLDHQTLKAELTAVRARRFIIATGAVPAVPKVDGIELVRASTVHSLGALAELPARLAVVGNAPAAYELAQTFSRLGSDVMLAGTGTEPPVPDLELMEVVQAGLRRDGVDLRLGRTVVRLQPRGTGVEVVLADQEGVPFGATHLLVAEGLKPFTESLGLDRAGVRCTAGVPAVGPDLRTSNRRIFAIGDVLGGPWPAGSAIPTQVGLVLRAAFFRQPVRFDSALVPRVLRTAPALAQVGLTETEARARSGKVKVFRWSFSDTERAVAAGQTGGHVKIVANAGGQVLGAGIVGPHADELIAPWSLAIAHGIRLDQMASWAVAQPSLADASRRAAVTFVAGRLRRPAMKRILGILRLFG